MTLPSSGKMSLSMIAAELGLSGKVSLGQSQLRNLVGKQSGQVRLSDFYGRRHLPAGTLLSTFCSGVNLYGIYASGDDINTYNGLIEANSTTCGYVPYPPAGQLVSTYCDNVGSYVGRYTDGNGGTYDSVIEYNSTQCNVNPGGSVNEHSCFTAGSLVLMADMSVKPIYQIKVGEQVMTVDGPQPVIEVRTPRLGSRLLVSFDNGLCNTSTEHAIWARDSDAKEWWATRDMEQWKKEAEDGTGADFGGLLPFDLTGKYDTPFEYAHLDGWISHRTVVQPAPEGTVLYHLIVEGSQNYFVDGYIVSSLASLKNFDWTTFKWQGLK